MTLQTKLVISFTVLLLAVIATVGVVASRSIETILVAQTDRTLLSIGTRGPRPEPGAFIPEPRGGSADLGAEAPPPDDTLRPLGAFDPFGDAPFLRSIAELWVTADGEVVRSTASGFADDPDPLPDLDGLDVDAGLVFLDSVDGSLRYRAHVVTYPDGSILVYAAPLSEVATAIASLVRALLLAGGGVLLLGAVATWWTVRSAIRPVDEMVDTAEAIAGGDLTRRVPDLNTTTELARLGTALNEMLTHIEEAVGAERATQDRLRQFVADASHELRTPITAISGYAELRRRGGLDSREAESKAWTRVEAESRRMGALVEELLILARLGQSHPLTIEQVDMMSVVRDAAADHATIDPRYPVGVSGPDGVVIDGDSERLHQVVSNLLENVRIHTAAGTAVEIDVTTGDEIVDVTVTDDGIGIPEPDLERVFDRFYRSDPSRSRRSGGSGLGLAIVRAIVEAHGGSVEAANAGDFGTRIAISLPRSRGAGLDEEAQP
jgi:two-component system OmpR family sensor kinase